MSRNTGNGKFVNFDEILATVVTVMNLAGFTLSTNISAIIMGHGSWNKELVETCSTKWIEIHRPLKVIFSFERVTL